MVLLVTDRDPPMVDPEGGTLDRPPPQDPPQALPPLPPVSLEETPTPRAPWPPSPPLPAWFPLIVLSVRTSDPALATPPPSPEHPPGPPGPPGPAPMCMGEVSASPP